MFFAGRASAPQDSEHDLKIWWTDEDTEHVHPRQGYFGNYVSIDFAIFYYS
jgi:hypothetical protein